MTLEEIFDKVLSVLPEATVGEDNEGQLIVYTNLYIVGPDNQYVSGEELPS